MVPGEPFDDLDGLLAGLSLAEDHLREAGADAAVQIELRAPDIIVGKGAQVVERLIDRQVAGFHLFEKSFERFAVHLFFPSPG